MLKTYFSLDENDNCWHHKRIDAEIKKAKMLAKAASDAGKKGAARRWNGVPHDTPKRSAKPPQCDRNGDTDTDTDTDTDSKENTTCSSSKCPYQEIIDAYHEELPMLPKLIKRTDARDKAMRARWSNGLSSIDEWREYFRKVRKQSWLLGNNQNGWRATLDWLCKEANYAKVIEGQYSRSNGTADRGSPV